MILYVNNEQNKTLHNSFGGLVHLLTYIYTIKMRMGIISNFPSRKAIKKS